MSHTFPSAGTRTVTLTVTDGWGRAASTTRQVTVSAT
jgi:PKD repeat protein